MARKRIGKKTYRKKRRMVRRVKNNMVTMRTLVEAFISINSTNAGGAASVGDLSYAFALNYPTYLGINAAANANTAQSWGAMATVTNTLPRLIALFDEYKVNSLTIRIIPNEMDTKTSATSPDLADYPSVLYTYNDIDDIVVATGETQMLNSGSRPVQWTFREHSFKFPQLREKRRVYLNTGNATVNPTTALTGNTMGLTDGYSSLKLLIPKQYQLAAGVTGYFGRIYATWDVTWRGIRNS